MALEVNNQNLLQNAQFQQFVDFAEAAVKAGGALIVLSIADWALGHSHDHLEAWPWARAMFCNLPAIRV